MHQFQIPNTAFSLFFSFSEFYSIHNSLFALQGGAQGEIHALKFLLGISSVSDAIYQPHLLLHRHPHLNNQQHSLNIALFVQPPSNTLEHQPILLSALLLICPYG